VAYIRVFIWPVIVCVLAFGFRSTLRSLLGVRLTQIDAPGFSAKFEQAAKDAERVVQAISSDAEVPKLDYSDFVVISPHAYDPDAAVKS
jgi:hypothetical protein